VRIFCGFAVSALTVVASAQSFKVIRNFSYPAFPSGRLLVVSNIIYGINGNSGGSEYGSIFRVKTDGTGYTILKNFSQTYLNADGNYTNSGGSTLLAGLILDGNTLYGTASQGGAFGKGTVFSLKTDGTDFTVLKQFAGIDGKAPYAELLLSGNVLYGTTAAGGISNKGTIFRLNTDGSDFALLKSFTVTDGLLPLGSLTLSGDTLYGTTLQGGAWNYGTVFSINTNGTGFVTLKDFLGTDGSRPRYNLVLFRDTLFGTTEGDGDLSNSLIFKLNTDGTDFQIVKSFSVPDPISGTNDDGFYVRSGLVRLGEVLFGTTSWGGNSGSGVIFALRMDNSAYTVLRCFSLVNNNGWNADGATPFPSLTRSGDTLFGTTQDGGSGGQGTLFSLNIAPQIQVTNDSPGFGTNGFGFAIAGYSNQIVVIEACTNLATPSWLPLETNVIGVNDNLFVDSASADIPRRFYRLRMQ
jgi:uncharacterized repeat protein (TIGR03803 family)